MFERFTEAARQVVVEAQTYARSRNSDRIGSEHLLVAVAALPDGIAPSVLSSFELTPVRLGIALDGIQPRIGGPTPDGQIPFSSQSKKAIELSLREALALGHRYIGSEHILLGLIRDSACAAVDLLKILGGDPNQLRKEIVADLEKAKGQHRAEKAEPKAQRAWSGNAEGSSSSPPSLSADENVRRIGDSIESIPTHSDRPAKTDELGRERLAEVLGERIRRVRGEDTTAPVANRRQRREKRRRDRDAARISGGFMVHLFAPWGAGKSSLLNFLGSNLRNRGGSSRTGSPASPTLSQWVVVDFSAWEHQRLVMPWWWLLAEIRRSCGRELRRLSFRRWMWFLVRDLGWRLWNGRMELLTLCVVVGLVIGAWLLDWLGLPGQSLASVNAVLVIVSAALALGASVLSLIRAFSRWMALGSAEGAARFMKRAHDPLGVYRQRFSWLVRSCDYPICVFIDDLDRCRSGYVVELLEGIQTLFSSEPVTYVVTADRRWLCESFATVYSDFAEAVGEPGRPLGYLFLEKTFQISAEIPPMPANRRDEYWGRLMETTPVVADGNDERHRVEELSRIFDSASSQTEIEERVELLSGSRRNDQVLAAAVRRLNAPDIERQEESLLGEFAPLVENNPRSMKRLLNAYGIERDRLFRDGHLLNKSQRRQLALLTILRLRWPQLAEHLSRHPRDAAFCCGGGVHAGQDNPFADLFEDAQVRSLFDGTCIDERLEVEFFESFPPDETGGERI